MSAPHVVLIEDDADVRRLVSRWLSRLGCSVTECPDGQGGLEAIAGRADRAVDLVLLDVLLPDLDGRDIYRRVRRLDADVPVLVTSIMTEGVTPLAEQDALLAKPFRRRDFERAVRRMIPLPDDHAVPARPVRTP